MNRRRRNPFYLLLGAVGFLFTITAMSYCMAVLRGVRPDRAAATRAHPVQQLMDRHGTAILAGELLVLAIATVGAVAVDHLAGERERAARAAARREAAPGADAP